MFSLAFLVSSISYLMIIFGITESTLLHYNFFQWSNIPIMISIFIAVNETIMPIKNFSKYFYIFILLFVLSFLIPIIPINMASQLAAVRIFISMEVILVSLYLFITRRHISFLFFTLSLVSFSVAGFAQGTQNEIISIYASVQAFFFLSLVFLQQSSFISSKSKGLHSYFSIQQELQSTKEELFKSREKYKAIVENTNDVILITQPNGTNSYVSPAVTSLFGYTPEEFLKLETYQIHPDDEEQVTAKREEGLKGKHGSNYEYRIITKNGNTKWISHSWSPVIEQNTLQMIVSSIRDITDMKQAEQKLQENISSLKKSELATLNIMEDFQENIQKLEYAEQKIREKNDSLKQTQKELQELNKNLETKVEERTKEIQKLLQQKDDFIHQLGHDLKTPLTPMTTLLPLIKKKIPDDKSQEMISILEKNVEYMTQLVKKTLSLAELNAPSTRFNIEKSNLFEELNYLLEIKQPIFDQYQMQVTNKINNNLIVETDKIRITELLDNLISNAVKYSPAGKEIIIDAKKLDDEIQVSIQDEGKGIPTDEIDHIFDEFYKTDKSRHSMESSGLGLSICKRIVDKLGGKIWVESPGKGKGSTFYFTIPINFKKNNDDTTKSS